VPSCCVFFDVRSGTMMIGLFLLVIYSSSLMFASSLFTGHHNTWQQQGLQDSRQWPFLSDLHPVIRQHSVDQEMVGMVFVSLYFVVVLLLIYGAALRRSSYVLPFFCLQFFDICLSILVAGTAIMYAHHIVPRINQIRIQNEISMEYAEYVSKMSVTRFRLLMVTINLLLLSIKYFMVSVVWSFFKYCRHYEERRLSRTVRRCANHLLLEEHLMVLPTYEDALKQQQDQQTPPPAYTVN